MRVAILLIAGLAICQWSLTTQAQPRTKNSSNQKPSAAVFTSGDKALSIPLDIDNKIILLRVSVNNSPPLKFIFDTGASISVLNRKRATELGLKSSKLATGDATGGRVTMAIVQGVSLSVAGASVSNQLLGTMDFPTPPGFEFDGVIGYGFISRFVVEIDYQKKLMNLYSPGTYRYSGKGEIIPLDLNGRKIPLVRTKISPAGHAPVELNLELDTGSDGTIVVNSPMVSKHQLLATMPEGVQAKARGAGGEADRVFGQVKAVQLGSFVFANPPVGLSLDTKGAGAATNNDGTIGGELLRRFKVIVDYSQRRMILERNSSFDEPYDVDG